MAAKQFSRFWVPATALALVAALVPVTALAQRESSGRERGNASQRLSERLNLTEDQQAALSGVLSAYHKDGRELRNKITEARLEIFDAINADQMDAEAIAAAGQALGDAEAEMAMHKAKLQQEIRLVLTPDQLRLQRSLNAQRRAMLEENEGEMPRGGQGGGRGAGGRGGSRGSGQGGR